MQNLGARIYGLGAILIGVTSILWASFATGWIPPPSPPPAALTYPVGALLVIGGVLINVPRYSAWGAALVAIVFAVGMTVLDLTHLAAHPLAFGYWESSAVQIAIVASGAIAFAANAKMDPVPASRIELVGRVIFGLCLIVFGAAHFVYFTYSEAFVPKWLPPSQAFWVGLTGVAAIAAAFAILSGILDLLAARLLTLMYVIFTLLVHVPFVIGDPANHGKWVENNVNIMLIGGAWIVAESLARKRTSHPGISPI